MTDPAGPNELSPLHGIIGMCHEQTEALKRVERLAFDAHKADQLDSNQQEARRAYSALRAALRGVLASVKVSFDTSSRLEETAAHQARRDAIRKRDALTVAHTRTDTITTKGQNDD